MSRLLKSLHHYRMLLLLQIQAVDFEGSEEDRLKCEQLRTRDETCIKELVFVKRCHDRK